MPLSSGHPSFKTLFHPLSVTTAAAHTMVSPRALLSCRTQVFEQSTHADNHEQTQDNSDPSDASASTSEAGTADGANTTAMPGPSPEIAQYIHSLIYQIPEIRQLVEAQGAAIQQHNEVLGHTQTKFDELAAQLGEVTKRIAHLAEHEEGEMLEHSGASPPKTSPLAKDVQDLQQEVKKMRGELFNLQSKAVKYESLVSRGAADSSAAQRPGLPTRPKLPAASTAAGSEIPKAPASMRQQNHHRSSQDVDAMNNKLRGLIGEIENLKKDQQNPSQPRNQLAKVPEKLPTIQNNQLVKRKDNDKLVLKSSSTQSQSMTVFNGKVRSEFITGCRQRLLFEGRTAIEEFVKRHEYEVAMRQNGAGIHASRKNFSVGRSSRFPCQSKWTKTDGQFDSRFRFAETAKLHTNMNFWNGRIINALDQAAMKGREKAGVKVVKDLVHQMERYRAGEVSVPEQCIKWEVNHEGIDIIKSWFKWTDDLFDELRRHELLEVPGIPNSTFARTNDDRSKWELASKRLMGSPPSHYGGAKRQVPNSFNSSSKRRAISPARHDNAKRHAPGVFSSPIKRRAASPPSSPYSVHDTRRHDFDVFRPFDKRRALSPLSDAEIARRHADSFLKNLDLQEASLTHHSHQYRSPRGEPYRVPEYHRDRDYYGPGTNIRSDFYPDMPIQERRFRRGDYM
ncbi:hypothetical protein IWX49DRAFT_298021 [Phyllosticta citricarpa]|uniref:Uncharacterized protein n=1 Tax=Phyllosticta citricarpa TaxID=55181 RepID=A0ABR1LLH5_9PEZI